MPTRISGLRIARSHLTPSGSAQASAEMDFNLSSRQGVSISAVLGIGHFSDRSPATSDTVVTDSVAHQTLHLETGALEDVPADDAEDVVNMDTEVFYMQEFSLLFQVPATAGGGGGSVYVMPSGLVTFAEPILTARNITHQAETRTTDAFLDAGVYVYYNFVEFSLSELGFILARRQ